ncbi:MAG: CerR family C-terminal domain-containing protein, partial [Pirellulales bacterium]|nr:CerR family C-terminal domain-containing protein [Pirellulales bacterium]
TKTGLAGVRTMANSEDTRTRILQAAGETFAARGYKAATVREICRQAGVNLAAVNYYFGDKEKLYLETLRHAHPDQNDMAHNPSWAPDDPPAQKLRAYVGRFLSRLMDTEADAWKMQLIQREILNPTPACRELLQSYFRANFGTLLGILEEVLPADMPEAKRHQIAFSIIGQCVYFRAASKVIQMIIPPEEYDSHFGVEELSDHVADVCLAALGLREPLVAAG